MHARERGAQGDLGSLLQQQLFLYVYHLASFGVLTSVEHCLPWNILPAPQAAVKYKVFSPFSPCLSVFYVAMTEFQRQTW